MTSEKTKVEINKTTREMIAERVFDAPRETVFHAWSDCDALSQWWGPRQWPLTYCNMDFRVGGVWHYCMTGPDKQESWGRGLYSEIVPPARIVYTDEFSDKDGNKAPGTPGMLITVEFLDEGGKTRLKSRAAFATDADLDAIVAMGAIDGMTETWDRLEEYLAAK